MTYMIGPFDLRLFSQEMIFFSAYTFPVNKKKACVWFYRTMEAHSRLNNARCVVKSLNTLAIQSVCSYVYGNPLEDQLKQSHIHRSAPRAPSISREVDARKEIKHPEKSMHTYLLFTGQLCYWLALQCHIVQVAEQPLLGYLNTVIQDMHAVLTHLLYFRRW
jgi:hypothetical protein